jgi:TPR repeat protein
MKMVVYLICAAMQTGVVLAQNSAVLPERIDEEIRELRERRKRIQEELSRMRAPQPRQGPDSRDAPSAAREPSAGSRNDPTPTGSSANAASRSSPSAAVPTAAPEASSALSVRPSPTEVDGLLKHGRELFAAGDITGARALFLRAAMSNEPSALTALAQTYDPQILGTIRVRGVKPDPTKAKALYDQAEAARKTR